MYGATEAFLAAESKVAILTIERDRLLAERDGYKAALEKYGRHTNDCSINFSDDCDCGWLEIWAALSPAKGGS